MAEVQVFSLRRTQTDPFVGRDAMLTLAAPGFPDRRDRRVQIAP